ncbi:hypothetical protein [Curtobacterium sp. MCPF17_052]|uniref:hypothetical protein n=1 Tax=Curtobacterium sp. MCPF17_052 TaxID=2175655 RepID=UPI000DA802DB|nr:hypothetical protein [Curtobacterium sp. MCPF17_052]WIB13721.1 hypothetical protein DEJ36_08570 [Curtobacterium sp. MCPF17_052]
MNRLFRAALRRAHDDDRGIVLANVIIFGTVLMMVVAGLLVLSTSGAVKSASDRDYQNAVAAAYAGLADYQSKISNDNGYAVYGTTANAQFSSTANAVFQGLGPNGTTNPAFVGWVGVPKTNDEWYRYEVDNSQYAAQGILKVRVTGKSGMTTRSIVANLKGDGFINYLYFTNYESAQPSITGANCTSNYQWQTNVSNTCGYVQFAARDVLNGPIRTNDTFTSCGAVFNGSVEDHDGTVNRPSGCASSTYLGGTPESAAYLGLPALNSNMSQEARADLPTLVPRPGCLYTGPTTVKLNGDGTMTVRSPWTKATQFRTAADGSTSASDTARAASLCGTVSALQSANGATIPTLPSNLVFVQDVPQTNTPTNVNYWGSAFPSGFSNTYCNTKVNVSNGTATTSATSTYSNGAGYPVAGEWMNGGSYSQYGTTFWRTGSVSDTYSCTEGDVFLSGGFSGAMTIAASGTIWLTGNVTYVNANTDVLGLVGQDAVEIWNPAKCSSFSGTACTSASLLRRNGGEDFEVDAGIASNAGTFWNQNYDLGRPLGTLTVKGSIAQNWRGIVATGGGTISTGFAKDYVYDSRFLTTAPPKFLQPVSTSYGVTTQVEVQPAFQANGVCARTPAGVCR